MTLPPLPVTVISGYLGAGKTTLINQLLRGAEGQRIMVLVNDFGAINIDADLLASADEDTLTLTNGCVCCTMGADLFMALGDALDRRPRPDVLIIEASGIAEPRRIAEAAKAEPELRYGGIVTVVDAQNFLQAEADAQVGPQVRGQIEAADLLVISKSAGKDEQLLQRLAELSPTTPMFAQEARLNALLLQNPQDIHRANAAHAEFAQWSYQGARTMTFEQISQKMATPPVGVFRIKGTVRAGEDEAWEVHLVGRSVDIRPASPVSETRLVAIGESEGFSAQTAERWWALDT